MQPYSGTEPSQVRLRVSRNLEQKPLRRALSSGPGCSLSATSLVVPRHCKRSHAALPGGWTPHSPFLLWSRVLRASREHPATRPGDGGQCQPLGSSAFLGSSGSGGQAVRRSKVPRELLSSLSRHWGLAQLLFSAVLLSLPTLTDDGTSHVVPQVPPLRLSG